MHEKNSNDFSREKIIVTTYTLLLKTFHPFIKMLCTIALRINVLLDLFPAT